MLTRPVRPGLSVGLLSYPDAQVSAVLGFRDVLEVASRLHVEHGGKPLALTVHHFEDMDRLPRLAVPLTALFLPPSLEGPPLRAQAELLSHWIRERHEEGTLLCSVCAGAFVLAETGLLNGRPATTHWGLRALFGERFPEVSLDTDKLMIDDGDIVTAGGLMAWVDLSLHLVSRFFGPSTMLATARHFLVDPGGREQRFYQIFSPSLTHGDSEILRVQRWLQASTDKPVSLGQMATKAHLGERTFLRRFQKATGMNPTEYTQHLRVGKARALLESSGLAIDEIAFRVGYQDAGAFRKVFQRILGLSAAEYRRRFAPR